MTRSAERQRVAFIVRRAAVRALFAVLAFAVHLTIARQLDRVHTFEQVNVLFDADISTRLRAFSDGLHLGIKHPNLMAYVTPPIALIAKLLIASHLAGGPEGELRRMLGVLVVPAASALKTALVVALCQRLGFSWAAVTVATLLDMLSFSTLIFGSVPESYGLSALALAMGYLLAVDARPALTRGRTALWIAVGVFATGITLTNVVLVVCLLSASAWKTSVHTVATAVRVIAVAVAIFGVTGVSAYGLDRLRVRPEPSAVVETVQSRMVESVRGQLMFVTDNPMGRLGRFPTAVANAFTPPAIQTVPMQTYVVGRYRFGFSLAHSPDIFGLDDPVGLSIFLLVVVGTLGWLANPASRPLAGASVAILMFGGLSSMWGSEPHLHSQHWHLAAVLLLAGVTRAGRWSGLMTAVLGGLALVIAINNLIILRALLATLAAVPP